MDRNPIDQYFEIFHRKSDFAQTFAKMFSFDFTEEKTNVFFTIVKIN